MFNIWEPLFLEKKRCPYKEFLKIQMLRFQFNFLGISSCSEGFGNETIFPLSLQFFFYLVILFLDLSDLCGFKYF